jgi:hypothetical protein
MTRRFVFMDQATARNTIDDWHSDPIRTFRLFLVKGFNCTHHLFYMRAYPGTDASITLPTLCCLMGTLYSLW